MPRRLLLAMSAVILVAACDDDAPSVSPAQPSLESAAEEMRELVDATVTEVVPDWPSVVNDQAGRHGCGSETEDVDIDYEQSISVPSADMPMVIDAVKDFWAAKGSEDERPGDGLTFSFDGFVVGLTPFSGENRITIGGSTDCFPPGSS